MQLFNNLKYKYNTLSVFEKLIGVNILVFLLSYFLRNYLVWFELPSTFNALIEKPWAIFTYVFLHYDFLHLFFNMLWLYVVGQLFLNLFSSKMAINIYFLGAIFGGFLFVLGYTLFPNFFIGTATLVGASAAIRALLIFICAYTPNQDIRFFTFNIKLWYVGVIIVILDVFGLFGVNSGGNLAHIGGSFLGWLYAYQLQKGNDIGRGFQSIVDLFTPRTNGGKKLKTVYKNKQKVGGYTKADFGEFNKQKQIDIILDKISKSGYDSLTAEEKEFLFRAGK